MRARMLALVACYGKLSFPNAAAAYRSMRAQHRDGRRLHRKQKPYRCITCGMYHLADDWSKRSRRPAYVPSATEWEDAMTQQ